MSKLSKLSTGLGQFFKTYSSTIKIAWQTDKSLFIKLTLVNAGTGALVYPSLLASKLLIDSVMLSITTGNPQAGLKTMIVAALLGLIIDQLGQVFNNLDGAWSFTMSNLVSEKISVSISGKVNSLPVSVSELPETRNALQKVMDNTGRSVWSLIIPISSFPDTIFSIISAAIPILSWNPIVLVPCIIMAIPNIMVGIRFGKEYHAFRTKQAPLWRIWSALENFAVMGRYLYENKILGHADILLTRRTKMSRTFFTKENKMRVDNAWRRQSVSIPQSIFETSTRLYLYYQAIVGVITLGSAQITSTAISRFISSLSRFVRQINDIFQNYLFIDDYEKFMSLEDDDNSGTLVLSQDLIEGIEFKDVWFKYNSSPNWILKGVSFKLDPKKNLAIVGENGAGKSTIIKLLCRFYEPQKGEILVNGLNIRQYNLKSYYHSLSALFQDFAQYPFSAKDNIHFGDITQKHSAKNIRQAAKLTGIHEFIKSLPLGYKNPLDKEYINGIEPSKGQWQRIALARVLFRPAPIIILDEPTSNVDPESEEQIFEAVLKAAKDKIIFLVSHRFSTVRKADEILVLDHGVVSEYGNHKVLMSHNGRYKELFNTQAQSYQ